MEPVHQAVESSDYEELAALLDAGADPNETCFGMTLLAHAIDLEGDSTLQSGCRLHGALTAIVLAYGADPELASHGGQTPLEIAEMPAQPDWSLLAGMVMAARVYE